MMIPSFLFISGGEIIFILFVVLLVFGADRIPEIARGLGKGMTTLRNATNDIKYEITKSVDEHVDTSVAKDVQEEIDKVKSDLEDFTGSVSRKR